MGRSPPRMLAADYTPDAKKAQHANPEDQPIRHRERRLSPRHLANHSEWVLSGAVCGSRPPPQPSRRERGEGGTRAAEGEGQLALRDRADVVVHVEEVLGIVFRLELL